MRTWPRLGFPEERLRSCSDEGTDLSRLSQLDVELLHEILPHSSYVGFSEDGIKEWPPKLRKAAKSTKFPGDKVVSTIKELLRESNAHHLVIKNDEGRTLIEFPASIVTRRKKTWKARRTECHY